MKKVFKSRIFLVIITAIICTTIGVTASVLYNASEIGFTPNNPNWNVNNLNDAINDLYKGKSTAVQVATLTTQGATYTMQNDGYITGTAQTSNGGSATLTLNNGNVLILTTSDTTIRPVSIYVTKDTTVTTRTDKGVYNLTVYEWK